MNSYFLIAKRFLFPRNNFRSNTINFISFIGLFIGAASIVLSISVLNGFQNILQTETKKLYGDYLVEDFNNSDWEPQFFGGTAQIVESNITDPFLSLIHI